MRRRRAPALGCLFVLVLVYYVLPAGADDPPYFHSSALYRVDNTTMEEYDISATGVRSTVSNVDDVPYQEVALSFTFFLYGSNYSSVFISANGFLSLDKDSPCDAFCVNGAGSTQYVDYIAPLQTDFDPRIGNGRVLYQHDTRLQCFTVQWDQVPLWNTTAGFTFGTRICENGTFTFYYISIPTLLATISPLTVGLAAANYPATVRDPMLVRDGTIFIFDNLPRCAYSTTCQRCAVHKDNFAWLPDQGNVSCAWCPATSTCSEVTQDSSGFTWLAGDTCPSALLSHDCPLDNLVDVVGSVIGAVIAVIMGGFVGCWYRRTTSVNPLIRAHAGRMFRRNTTVVQRIRVDQDAP